MSSRKEHSIDFVEFPAKDNAGLERSKRFFAEAFGWSYQDGGADYADTTSSGLNADPAHRRTTRWSYSTHFQP